MLSVIETPLWLSVGEMDSTVGAVVSEVVLVLSEVSFSVVVTEFSECSSFSSPQEMMVKLKNEIRRMYINFFKFVPLKNNYISTKKEEVTLPNLLAMSSS